MNQENQVKFSSLDHELRDEILTILSLTTASGELSAEFLLLFTPLFLSSFSDINRGASNFIKNAPNGAVTSIDNTAIVTISSLAEMYAAEELLYWKRASAINKRICKVGKHSKSSFLNFPHCCSKSVCTSNRSLNRGLREPRQTDEQTLSITEFTIILSNQKSHHCPQPQTNRQQAARLEKLSQTTFNIHHIEFGANQHKHSWF